jgi:2-oxoisovalerate dehydrogenase E1 component
MIMEECLNFLDAPQRVASLDTPRKPREDQYLPKGRFERVLLDLIAY